ncbi:hypothetical protein PVAND_015513 [Polypedilum vanderplanki]|uniref:Ankyrin repeat protein n=1 Tax=Polypedilum vanderplanki TaxID=319348 RepID=A0A9J6BDA6_POLVA|nr:hypothetical protein PVAND_015513 [Polypedilum vanderplanki]
MDKEKSENTAVNVFSINYCDEVETFITTVNDLNESIDIITIVIQNCPSTTAACKFISNYQISETILNKFPSTLVIKILINGEFEAEKFMQNFWFRRKILVSFESSDEIHKIIYWKNGEYGNFMKFHFDIEKPSKDVKAFVIDFIFNSLKLNRSAKFSNQYDQLIYLNDSRGFNLLMSAVENESIEILRELFQLPFNINHKTIEDQTAADIAWENKNQKILLELLNANSTFPKDFDEHECSEEIKKFLKVTNELHKAIENNNKEKVEIILNENKKLRHFYNSSNNSAAAIAINNPEIYKLLTDKNCSIGPLEGKEELLKLPQKHIQIHLINSYFVYDEFDKDTKFKCIRKFFERIDSFPEGELFLKLSATFQPVTNNFDFYSDTLQHMTPNYDVSEISKFSFFIAAQKLLDKEKKIEVDEFMMHEFGHFVLKKVFRNGAQPFENSDKDKENSVKFFEITNEIYNLWKRNKKNTEPIVAKIFEDCKFGHTEELIVTIPQMFCHYRNDFEKLKKLRHFYKKIFGYFHDFVMPAMKNSLKIYEKLADKRLEISFDELPESIKSAIRYKIVNFQGQEVIFNQISNEEVLKSLSSVKIRELLSIENFKIGKTSMISFNSYIDRRAIDFDYQKPIYNFNYENEEFELTEKAKEKSMEIEFYNFICEIEISKFLLLSDHIDAVKSSTVKQICLKTKENRRNSFVAFIDVKNHLKILEKFKNEEQNGSIFDFNYEKQQKRIIKTLIEILQLTDDLECSIFKHLLDANQMVLFFVNLDEIPIEIFSKFLENIRRATKIQNCIAAGPKVIEIIKNDFKLKANKLLPLEEAKTKEFIENFTKDEKIDVELKIKIKEICENLKFLDNPLLHRMVVDLYMAGKLTKNLNRFSFFDEFVELKNENLNLKADSKFSIWKIHQIYAIQAVFLRENFESSKEHERQSRMLNFNYFDEFKLFKQWKIEKPKWTAIDIERCGFLQIKNWNSEKETFEFMHITFAEFFAAKFIIDSVKKAIQVENLDEFKLTMELAEFLIQEFCKTRKNDEGIFVFIFDYLALNDFKEIQIGEEFMNFLLSHEVKNFISIILSEKFWFSKFKIAKIILSLLKLPQLNDLKFVNNLTVIENGHSKLFQVLFTNRNSAVEIVELFKIFKSSNLPNWHQMTGFGKNIEKLENDSEIQDKFEIKTDTKMDEFENQDNIETENVSQILWLIANADDIQTKDIHKFLLNFSHHFSLMVIKSHTMMKNFIKIAEKSFHESKEKFAEIAEKFIQGLFLDIEKFLNINQNSQFVENLNKFFQLLQKFFISEPKFENHLVAKIDKIFEISQPNSDEKLMFMKTEESKNLSCFQILFIFCENFDKIAKAIEIMKGRFWDENDKEWLEMTGYKNTKNDMKIIDDIERNFSIDIFKILHLNIPKLHLEYFYDCHVAKVIILAIIHENDFLFEKTFELFKKLNFSINFRSFLFEVSFYTNDIKEKRRKIIKNLISVLLEIDEFSNSKLSEIKNFRVHLLERNLNFKSYNLFAAISFNDENQLHFYTKRYNSDEILNLFFNNLEQIYFMDNYNPKLYRNFFIENFDENFISETIDECENSENYFDRNFLQIIYDFLNLVSQINCSLKDLENFFEKKLFSIVNVIFSSSLFADKLFEILSKNFDDKKLKSTEWLRDGFGKTTFFNPEDENDKKKVSECYKNIELIFTKYEDFLQSQPVSKMEINTEKSCELMKKFLLNDYQNCHPLVIAIYYDINFLKDFYFKYCDIQEILKNLIVNINPISKFYDEEFFGKFFTKYFVSDNEKKKIKLRKILKNIKSDFGKKSIWKNAIEILNASWYSESFSKNILKFLKFFFKFVNSLEVSIFKFFYLSNTYEILMSILKDTQIICDENDKNFLRKRNEKFYYHPLLKAIDENYDDELVVYKKIFNSNDFLKIFIKNIHKIVHLDEFNSKNFIEFFIEIFDENFVSRSAGGIEKVDDNYGDEYSENSYSNDSEIEDAKNNQLQIIYDFLCLLPNLNCPRDDLENFFHHKLSFIFTHTFTCYSMMLKIFEIFRKKFYKEKSKVLDWIRKGIDLTNFFNQIYKNNVTIVRPNIEKFWAKVETFVNSDQKLMKQILLGDYKKIHPFSIAIRHDIDGVKKLYLKYCRIEEIFQNLTSNLNSVSRYFYNEKEQELYEKFFNENFSSNEQVKILFKEFLDEKDAHNEAVYSIAQLFEEEF